MIDSVHVLDVLQHQLWVAAAEPEHAFREDSPCAAAGCQCDAPLQITELATGASSS